MANNNKIGTEEAGRKIRYEFFEQIGIKTNAQKIAIAHNKNDNVETIIMNALRGASISGLKGIQPSNGKIIRPLIECSRDEIEEFCREFNLNPKIDKTNFENIYTRNKIRNIVIPYIKKEFNSNIIETLNRLSYTVRKEDSFIEKIVIEEFNKLKIKEEEKANRLIVSEEENNLPSSFVLFVEYRLTWSALGGCGSNEYEYNKETPNRSMWTRVRAILCYGSVFKSIWSFHFSVSTFIH